MTTKIHYQFIHISEISRNMSDDEVIDDATEIVGDEDDTKYESDIYV